MASPVPRFTDNGNGTVTDNLTGLVWLKNADYYSPMSWSSALSAVRSLAHGTGGLTDDSVAGLSGIRGKGGPDTLTDADAVSNRCYRVVVGVP